MSASDIDYGFSILRVIPGDAFSPPEPVGVIAWDSSRRWFDVRLLDQKEVPPGVPKNRLALAKVAARDLQTWASKRRVPYSTSSAEPWTGEFWSAVHRFLSSGVRADAPAAMQRMHDPAEEFPLLFEAVARPRKSATRRKIAGYINEALGKPLRSRLLARPTMGAYRGRDEVVARAAVGTSAAVLIEGVNLAHQTGRRDADALVSRLERIIEGQRGHRELTILVGYLASPGGLNGESDMKAWIEERVADGGTFNLISQDAQFRDATQKALRRAGFTDITSPLL
ncbi:MAG: hypothetical protein R3E10_10440 [Gemmatimonadota bacterium]